MNNFLDIDYLKSLPMKPYYFGLGFIQLKLNDKERIHFWHKELIKTAKEEELHNHRYDFKSYVLKGKLVNEVYTATAADESNYGLYTVSCKEGSEEESKYVTDVDVHHICTFETTEGQSYTLTNPFFHKAFTEGCITFLERQPYAKEIANVITEKDKSITCPFSIKLSQNEIWEYIKELTLL